MGSDRDTLLGMGFDQSRVDWAMKATGNRGLQPAMDHILANEGKPVPDPGSVTEAPASSGGAMDVDDDEDAEALKALGVSAGSEVEAKSIKCSICSKVFRNTALANFHAEKSGHDQFEESTEEIKPLTEEEKKERLEELRAKMGEKRAKKAVEDAKEQKANEDIRRKAGKDMTQIREDLQAKEIMKEQEQKRRDKIEDAKAKAAVKAQIEADKKARVEKAAREKALREGRSVEATPAAAIPKPAAATSSSNAKEARIQIRLASGGQPLTTTLPSESPLQAVADFVTSQNTSIDASSLSFTQSFPRKTFTQADFSKTLKELGLTPSAALMAS
ncbi:DNA-binding protein [Pterulicium gracile]|uniref:DNA-binding protein n=1 Tax=Pterulicium gracile TaxID=1884261 RepID=A0A5C3QU15_9AGAR|nr:DNA-binding protein [Pterula gracilis]